MKGEVMFFFFREFEDICIELLRQYFDEVESQVHIDIGNRAFEADSITKDQDGVSSLFEFKYYSSKSVSHHLLEKACIKLEQVNQYREFGKLYLVTNLKVDDYSKESIFDDFGVNVIDADNLLYLVREFPDIKSELIDILDIRSDNEHNFEEKAFNFFEYYDFSRIEQSYEDVGIEQSYISRLKGLKPGKRYFRKYEILSSEILKFLLERDLIGWQEQCITEDGLNRYDLICRIRSKVSIWDVICNDFNSRYVLFEFKNYKDKITQKEVYTTEKYLFKTARRSVGFIISRLGPSDNARIATDGILRETGKLLIHLSDQDLVTMLEMFEVGSDPCDHLLAVVDDVLMKLAK